MNAIRFLYCLGLLVLLICVPTNVLLAKNRSLRVNVTSGIATAVVVDDQALAHTTQLLPLNGKGQIAAGDLKSQVAQVVANLREVLQAVGSDLAQIARLNVYLDSEVTETAVQKLLTRGLLGEVNPAVTYVVTALANDDALLAVDAIASVPGSDAVEVIRSTYSELSEHHGTTLANVLPRGRVVYISGMAEKTDDLAEATTGTMRQLHDVLKLLRLEPKHVVHIKSFVQPMAKVAVSRNAIRQMYPDMMSPPMSFTEWESSLPIEIEMIAFIPGEAEANETVQLQWRPNEKRSPVYCRFAVVNASTRIYVSGLRSREKLDATGQVRDIYAQLGEVLRPVGSDLRHLVKATYYVANGEVSKALNDVRPSIYDPERPPAASKAMIAGTGDAERTIVIDMIAVPGRW
jgi:enamine deaminase RidA (YjgF/YER057c/UK114 family)